MQQGDWQGLLVGAIAKINGKFSGVNYQTIGSWGKIPDDWRYTRLKNKLVWFANDGFSNGGVDEVMLRLLDENGKSMIEDVIISSSTIGSCADTKCEKKATDIKGRLMNI